MDRASAIWTLIVLYTIVVAAIATKLGILAGGAYN